MRYEKFPRWACAGDAEGLGFIVLMTKFTGPKLNQVDIEGFSGESERADGRNATVGQYMALVRTDRGKPRLSASCCLNSAVIVTRKFR